MSSTDIDPEIAAIASEFALLDDWEERYRHVIALGKALPALPDALRSEAAKVAGCASQVWLVARAEAGPPARIDFLGDSDAHIVRGLLALLLRLYSGRTPQAILALDARGALERIGLAQHLSPQRSNGLNAMIARIRAEALAAAAAS